MDDNVKYKAISKIQLEVPLKDIADELDVPYSSVVRLKAQYEEAKLNNTVNQLVDIDRVMIEELKDRFPVDEVDKLVKGVDGLSVLDTELQDTATKIVQRARAGVLSADMDELNLITTILCKVRESFFNKNITQVNVQTNIGGNNANANNPYSSFLKDAPGTTNN